MIKRLNPYGTLFIALFGMLFSKAPVQAQEPVFGRYTAEHGLIDNRVLCGYQDHRGYMWFGTNPGLSRFDGSRFTSFALPGRDSSEVSFQNVCAIFEDSDQVLWVISDLGLNKYNRQTEEFRLYPLLEERAEVSRYQQIGAIIQDQLGNIWFGNQKGGIYRFNTHLEEYTCYKKPEKGISSLFIDHSGVVWAGTHGSELYAFDRKADFFKLMLRITDNQNVIPDNYLWNISEDNKGNLILASSTGLFEFNPASEILSRLDYLPEAFSSFRNNEIRYMFKESEKAIWIGTWGKGLYRYDPILGKTDNYQVQPWSTNSLSNNDVNFIYKDRSNVVWVGTQDGLNYIDPAKSLFRKYTNNPNEAHSLHFNFITTFCEDRREQIWIGTYGGGLSLFKPESEVFTAIKHIPGNSNSLVNNAIRAICEDVSGNIWIGTMKGLDKYNPKNRQFTHVSFTGLDQNGVNSNDILCVINGNRNDIWVGTYGGGIQRIILPAGQGQEMEFEHFIHNPDNPSSLANNYIRSLFQDRSGLLWIGTLGAGVSVLDPQTGEVEHLSKIINDTSANQLIGNNVNCIHEDIKGNIWIGSWDGISILNAGRDSISVYDIENGMPDNNISEIEEDLYGNIWVSTFKGIVKIAESADGRTIKQFNTTNGLQGNKFNVNASLRSRDGKIYFGGTTGFNLIDPQGIHTFTDPPPVVLSSLQVFNEEVIPGAKVNGRVILDHSIAETKAITLTNNERIISLEFSALHYSEPDKIKYRYYLEGLDMDWVIVDAKRPFVSYSNLKRGDYVFRVQAANSDGIWNESGATLGIKVLPPSWQTWWAFIIYLIVVAFFLFLARNYSVARANLKNEIKYEQMEREKANELNQMKLRFFTNISHEFRTPLTLIIGPLEKLSEMVSLPRKALDHIHLVNRNARRLLHLLNQLMDFRKIDTGNTKLKAAEADIIEFVHEIKMAFDNLAREHRIRYELITETHQQLVWFDKDKLEIILYNLLSNAFKFTSDRGRVSIRIKVRPEAKMKKTMIRLPGKSTHSAQPETMDGPHVMISVKDTGRGIPKEMVSKIFDRFFQVENTQALRKTYKDTGTGIGLAITREFIELHHGKITVASVMDEGTVFRVFLPLGSEHLKESEKVDDSAILTSDAVTIDSVLYADDPESQYKEMEKSLIDENSSSMKRILLVEDNHEIRRFVKGCIDTEYKVYETDNAIDGIDLALKEVPDVIISDIRMPVMDGHEFCEKIKSDVRTSHIPVILLTAFNTADNRIQGYEKGADAYIVKPFQSKLLNTRIRNLIDSRQNLKELFSSDLAVNPRRITMNELDEKFMKNAVSFVQNSMADPEFSVVSLGRELGMSRTNLFRKMKALTDQSASEFIRSIRMKKAAQSLLAGYNVSQVMYEVGINSRSYFNKCFFQHYHMTPSEYVKEHIY